ncbi:MAG: hypothetical protein Q9227_008624 [Pyrenula ochraceoflavens]
MAGLNLEIPTVKLPDGNSIPILSYGLGTAWYKRNDNGSLDQPTIDGCKTAIKLGYYHLDGAEMYNTEQELGKAIKESGVPRDKLFVTTKVHKSINDIPTAIDASLSRLGLKYVDLYLIHSPNSVGNADHGKLKEAWKAMEKVKQEGKAKSIGVSNFLKPDLDAILEIATIAPAINQTEFHPYLQRGDLIPYNKEKGIAVSAYGPLVPLTSAKGGPLDQYLEGLAKKYAVEPAEILLRWCLDQDVIAITTSSKEQRLSDYLRCLTFKLTPRELEEISKIGSEKHYRAFWQKNFDENDRT